jgi:hypothetical protein
MDDQLLSFGSVVFSRVSFIPFLSRIAGPATPVRERCARRGRRSRRPKGPRPCGDGLISEGAYDELHAHRPFPTSCPTLSRLASFCVVRCRGPGSRNQQNFADRA